MTGRPLTIHVTDLLHRPGTRREVRRSVVLEGLAVSASKVPDGAAVDLELEVESMSDGIVAFGTIHAPYVGECRRCLGEVHGVAECPVREIFERKPVDGETYPLVGDHVDLEDLVREAVLLNLPLAPLCADGCLGPAPEVFPATVVAGDDDDVADDPPKDPRWSALDQLKLD